MSNCQIVTDISSGLNQVAISATHVHVVPMTIYVGASEKPQEIDEPAEFWQQCSSEHRGTVRIAQPSPGDFFRVYNRLYAEDGSILSVHSSQVFSKTVRAASVAAEMIDDSRIRVVDSGLIGPPMGQAVLEAAALTEEDRHAEEIARSVEEFADRVEAFFCAADLGFSTAMKKKGVAVLTSRLRSMLARSNLYCMTDGRLEPLKGRVRPAEAPEYLVKLLLTDEGRIPEGTSLVGIMSAGADSHAARIKRLLQEANVEVEVEQWTIDPVLGTFLGPGSVGVFAVE